MKTNMQNRLEYWNTEVDGKCTRGAKSWMTPDWQGHIFDPFLHLHPLRDDENSTTICGTVYAKHSF